PGRQPVDRPRARQVRPPAGIAGPDRVEGDEAFARVTCLSRDRERSPRVARVDVAGPLRLWAEVEERAVARAARHADDVLAVLANRVAFGVADLVRAPALLERARGEHAHGDAAAAVEAERVGRREVQDARPVRLAVLRYVRH